MQRDSKDSRRNRNGQNAMLVNDLELPIGHVFKCPIPISLIKDESVEHVLQVPYSATAPKWYEYLPQDASLIYLKDKDVLVHDSIQLNPNRTLILSYRIAAGCQYGKDVCDKLVNHYGNCYNILRNLQLDVEKQSMSVSGIVMFAPSIGEKIWLSSYDVAVLAYTNGLIS